MYMSSEGSKRSLQLEIFWIMSVFAGYIDDHNWFVNLNYFPGQFNRPSHI